MGKLDTQQGWGDPDGELDVDQTTADVIDERAEFVRGGGGETSDHTHSERAREGVGRGSSERKVEDQKPFVGGDRGKNREEEHRREVHPTRLRVAGEGGADELMRIPGWNLEMTKAFAEKAVPR